MRRQPLSDLILDAGAFVAWGGARQARLAKPLGGGAVDERPLDPAAARRVGLLAARSGLADIVDGHVAALAGQNATVVSSDPADLIRCGIPPHRIVHC